MPLLNSDNNKVLCRRAISYACLTHTLRLHQIKASPSPSKKTLKNRQDKSNKISEVA